MRISDILRTKPRQLVSLPPSASAFEAACLMAAEKVGAVIVCDGLGRPLGVVSERDLPMAIASPAAQPIVSRKLVELMHVGGPVVSPADPVSSVVRTMTERRTRHVPVVDGEALIGVVSIGDLLKARLTEKTEENSVLQEIARARLAA
jgi:CBS domain-containing protein